MSSSKVCPTGESSLPSAQRFVATGELDSCGFDRLSVLGDLERACTLLLANQLQQIWQAAAPAVRTTDAVSVIEIDSRFAEFGTRRPAASARRR